MAVRHGLAIVPVAAAGVDDTYVGLNDGYRTGKRVGMPLRLPLWLAVGAGGCFPFAPPWPVKVSQRIGAPMTVGCALDDADGMRTAHQGVVTEVQRLLDEARQAARRPPKATR